MHVYPSIPLTKHKYNRLALEDYQNKHKFNLFMSNVVYVD